MIYYRGKVPKEFEKYLKNGAKKEPKYKNRKTQVGELTFDSQLEANRYLELKMLEKAGQISDLKLQVKYTLIPSQKLRNGRKEKECNYIADFTYTDRITGEFVCEDTKGHKTKEYIIKRKLMLWIHDIEIKEVKQ